MLNRRLLISCSLVVALAGCADGVAPPEFGGDQDWTHPSPEGLPSVAAESAVEAGRYLAVVASCNDCHTQGWRSGRRIPESQWLAGSPLGFEGPWGVTFASNLRLRAQEWTEDEWVQTLLTRKEREPMPWLAVNVMSDKDARAFYRFLRHLGPHGEHMPEALRPGEPIGLPYISLRGWPADTALQAVPVP